MNFERFVAVIVFLGLFYYITAMSYHSIINENYFAIGFISLFTVVLITSYIILRNDLVSTEDIDELQSNVNQCKAFLKDNNFIQRYPKALDKGTDFLLAVEKAPNDLRNKDLFKINTKHIKFYRYLDRYLTNVNDTNELESSINKMKDIKRNLKG